jgi:hypothetical protein
VAFFAPEKSKPALDNIFFAKTFPYFFQARCFGSYMAKVPEPAWSVLENHNHWRDITPLSAQQS